jgi:hypothetical protein
MWINKIITAVIPMAVTDLYHWITSEDKPVKPKRQYTKRRKSTKPKDVTKFTPEQVEYILNLRKEGNSFEAVTAKANEKFGTTKGYSAYYHLIKKNGVQ